MSKVKSFLIWLFKTITHFAPLISILAAWVIIYIIWVQYPQRLINDDKIDSNQLTSSIWVHKDEKGISTLDSSQLEGASRYNAIGEKYGTYGDMYGSLNTLFSGLAFSTLIISLFLQMLELRATRKELADQKEALRGQQQESSKQTEILNQQIKIAADQKDITDNQHKIISEQFKEAQKKNFSDQFYSLLAERHNLLSQMIVIVDNRELRGFQVLVKYAEKFREIRGQYNPENHDKQFFKDQWYIFTEELYGSKTYQIHSYFKLYRLLFLMINNSSALSDSEKKMYIQIVKNFIDVEEKFILMWLGCFYGSLKTMCNKYAMLDGINSAELENIGLNFFEASAFGNSKSWAKTFEESLDIKSKQ